MSPKRKTEAPIDDDYDPEFDGPAEPTAARSGTGWLGRTAGFTNRLGQNVRTGPRRTRGSTSTDSPPAKPSQMQPPEDLYGYAVAALVTVIGVLFTMYHAKGTTAHPAQTNNLFPLLGVVAALSLVVVIRVGNRFASAIVAIISALLVESSNPPTDLRPLFYLTLVAPLGWAFWLTRRQSKAARALAATRPRLTPEQRRAAKERRKAIKRGEEVPASARATPSQNRRYTPPLPPTPKRTRKELAAQAAEEAESARRGSAKKAGNPKRVGTTASSGSKRRLRRSATDHTDQPPD